jgi:hypothetical protein
VSQTQQKKHIKRKRIRKKQKTKKQKKTQKATFVLAESSPYTHTHTHTHTHIKEPNMSEENTHAATTSVRSGKRGAVAVQEAHRTETAGSTNMDHDHDHEDEQEDEQEDEEGDENVDTDESDSLLVDVDTVTHAPSYEMEDLPPEEDNGALGIADFLGDLSDLSGQNNGMNAEGPGWAGSVAVKTMTRIGPGASRVSLAELSRHLGTKTLPANDPAASSIAAHILRSEKLQDTPTTAKQVSEIFAARATFSDFEQSSLESLVQKVGTARTAYPDGAHLWARTVGGPKAMHPTHETMPVEPEYSPADRPEHKFNWYAPPTGSSTQPLHRESDVDIIPDHEMPLLGPLRASMVPTEIVRHPQFVSELKRSTSGLFDLPRLLLGSLVVHPHSQLDRETMSFVLSGVTGPTVCLLQQAIALVGVPGILVAETHRMCSNGAPASALTRQLECLQFEGNERTYKELFFPAALPYPGSICRAGADPPGTAFAEARRFLVPPPPVGRAAHERHHADCAKHHRSSDAEPPAPITSDERPNRWLVMHGAIDTATADAARASLATPQVKRATRGTAPEDVQARQDAERDLLHNKLTTQLPRERVSMLEALGACPPPGMSGGAGQSDIDTLAEALSKRLRVEMARGIIDPTISLGGLESEPLEARTLPIHKSEDVPSVAAPNHVNPSSGRPVTLLQSDDITVVEKTTGHVCYARPDVLLIPTTGAIDVHVQVTLGAVNEAINPAMVLGLTNGYPYNYVRPRVTIPGMSVVGNEPHWHVGHNKRTGWTLPTSAPDVSAPAGPDGLGAVLSDPYTRQPQIPTEHAISLTLACKTRQVFRLRNLPQGHGRTRPQHVTIQYEDDPILGFEKGNAPDKEKIPHDANANANTNTNTNTARNRRREKRKTETSQGPTLVINQSACNACGHCQEMMHVGASTTDTDHVLTVESFSASLSPHALVESMRSTVENVLSDATPYFQDILPTEVLTQYRENEQSVRLPIQAELPLHARGRLEMHGRDDTTMLRRAWNGEWVARGGDRPSQACMAAGKSGLSFLL